MKYSVIGGLAGLVIGALMSLLQGIDRLSSDSTVILLVILNALVLIFAGFIIGNAIDKKEQKSSGNWFLTSLILSMVVFFAFLIVFRLIERDFDFYGSMIILFAVVTLILLVRIRWRVASIPLLLIAMLPILLILSFIMRGVGHLLNSKILLVIFDSIPFLLFLGLPFAFLILGLIASINGIIMLIRKDDRRKIAWTNLIVGLLVLIPGIVLFVLLQTGTINLSM